MSTKHSWFSPERPLLIAGPCVAESYDLLDTTAAALKSIGESLAWPVIFKSSFDKANRTSGASQRGPGMDKALSWLEDIRNKYSLALLTDVHESWQVSEVAQVVDVLQIPAFLCRQTDLLAAAGASGKYVNIKKGQFMAAEDMQFAVQKTGELPRDRVWLTERGNSFGYRDLVVDFRNIPIMRNFAPVIFDATHSVQQPGAAKGKTGGNRAMIPYLLRAALAVGVDGLFLETHPNPDMAWSDGPNMIPLNALEAVLKDAAPFFRSMKQA